jgi:hypothetical protein
MGAPRGAFFLARDLPTKVPLLPRPLKTDFSRCSSYKTRNRPPNVGVSLEARALF